MSIEQPVLIIGNGRLARHLTHWCSLLGKSVSTWQRGQHLDLTNIDLIWLAISDKSLLSFYEQTLKPHLTTQKVVHFSGTVHHPELISAHPLMTFSHSLYDLKTYSNIFFALTGADHLQQALPFFANPFFKMAPENKELYHALCVAAGNLPQILWSKTQPLFADLKIPPQALQAYLTQSLTNFFSLGANAVTGPIIRGDKTTIEKNLVALEKAQPELAAIYKGFL